MKIPHKDLQSGRTRKAARDLSPAQKGIVRVIETRLDLLEKHLQQARAALDKWKQGERFTPQLDNVKSYLKAVFSGGKALLAIVDKL